MPHSRTLRLPHDLKIDLRLREDDTEFVVAAVPGIDTEGLHNSHYCGLGSRTTSINTPDVTLAKARAHPEMQPQPQGV